MPVAAPVPEVEVKVKAKAKAKGAETHGDSWPMAVLCEAKAKPSPRHPKGNRRSVLTPKVRPKKRSEEAVDVKPRLERGGHRGWVSSEA